MTKPSKEFVKRVKEMLPIWRQNKLIVRDYANICWYFYQIGLDERPVVVPITLREREAKCPECEEEFYSFAFTNYYKDKLFKAPKHCPGCGIKLNWSREYHHANS